MPAARAAEGERLARVQIRAAAQGDRRRIDYSELERLVGEKLDELGEGWRLHSVVPYFRDPLIRPALKARIEKQEIFPLAPEVGDYIVIFEQP